MDLFERLTLKHSIEIETTAEKIWEFFLELDRNYRLWHPDDHILFRWTKGKPLEPGARFYAEQYAVGRPTIYKGKISGTVPFKKIIIKFSFPISLVTAKIEWIIEPLDSGVVFNSITYLRFGGIYRRFFKKSLEKITLAHHVHASVEGNNLKTILESDSQWSAK